MSRHMEAIARVGKGADVTEEVGAISLCPHKGCAFKCCDFQQTAAILLYPGEIEAALAEGKLVTHLEILDPNYHGGMRARCRALDTRSCDQGYKPLDCASYPLFPVLLPKTDDATPASSLVVKDSVCPIHSSEILDHGRFVVDAWNRLMKTNAAVKSWLTSIYPDNVRADDTDFIHL
jgi:hypothetical protein